MGPRPLSIHLAGETVELLPERAIHWPVRQTLIAADLHWGKSETFRQSGIPIPDQLIQEDLARLGSALRQSGARRLLVLGDLIHALCGLTPALVRRVSEWRGRHPIRFSVIRGNHDRGLREIPSGWDLEMIEEALVEEPFTFAHEPTLRAGSYVLAGHLHPVLTLEGAGDRLRLPCFYLGREMGVLPAFSRFTGGFEMKRSPEARAFVIAEETVVEV